VHFYEIDLQMLQERLQRKNEGNVLVNLPDHLADEYPVETNYAFKEFSSHLSRLTTDVT